MKTKNDFFHRFIFRRLASVATILLTALLLVSGCDSGGGLTGDQLDRTAQLSGSAKKVRKAKLIKSSEMGQVSKAV